MKKILTIIAVMTAILAFAPEMTARPQRPAMRDQSGVAVGQTDDSDRLETTVRDGSLYITVSRTMTVRIYSILGQLVTQQTLQPGTTRVRLATRGVYILKSGQLTRRITV